MANNEPEGPYAKKLKYIIRESYDDLTDLGETLKGYDAFLCTLGTRVNTGKENFIRVDYTYPLNFAKLAKKLEIPYYGLLTSASTNKNSWFLYLKTKGRVEEDI